MKNQDKIHREITPLCGQDSFLLFDRVKDVFDFPIHFHPEMELNFIAKGKGLCRVMGDSMEEIGDLELVLVGSGLYHGWEQHNCVSTGVHEITIQFHNDLFGESLLQRSIMKPVREMFARSTRGILFSQETIKSLEPRILKVSKLEGFEYFMELLSLFYDLANSKNQRLLSTTAQKIGKLEKSDRSQLLYDYVQENYHSKIMLEDISDLLNMSTVSFNRFIKKRTGKTFVEYLNDVRIGYASRWLIEKDLSISEIAFICGFNNIANFNRIFKKIRRKTPKQYRSDFIGIKRVL